MTAAHSLSVYVRSSVACRLCVCVCQPCACLPVCVCDCVMCCCCSCRLCFCGSPSQGGRATMATNNKRAWRCCYPNLPLASRQCVKPTTAASIPTNAIYWPIIRLSSLSICARHLRCNYNKHVCARPLRCGASTPNASACTTSCGTHTNWLWLYATTTPAAAGLLHNEREPTALPTFTVCAKAGDQGLPKPSDATATASTRHCCYCDTCHRASLSYHTPFTCNTNATTAAARRAAVRASAQPSC
jgi:hypothetical protein